MALYVRGRSFLFGCQGRTDTSTRTFWETIYTVHKPIRHNPGVSLPLIISGHGFCDYPWLSRLKGGPFSLANREKTGTSASIFGSNIYPVPKPIRYNPVWFITSDYFRSLILWLSMAL